MVLCVLAGMSVARVFRTNPAINRWSLLPTGLAATVWLTIVLNRALVWTWITTGALCGFLILASWSVGPFYISGTLVLLLAAVANLLATAGWQRPFAVATSFVAGGSGICIVFLAVDWLRENRYGMTVTHAPAVLLGSWTFVLVAASFVLRLIVRPADRHVR